MNFKYASGATPLDPDEINGLIPIHITTQHQLNEWEAANILKAENWLNFISSQTDFLTIDFVRLVHKKMFGDTWRWAGIFRGTNKNIGKDYSMITTELLNLLEDIKYQIKFDVYSIDEIAFRFHHRLVQIHPFPNGNGRHARMMTELLLVQAGKPKFTWGKKTLMTESPNRKKYIQALRQADNHDYSALAAFVRS